MSHCIPEATLKPKLKSSLLTDGSQMAKRNTVHKNKSNDQSEWDKNVFSLCLKLSLSCKFTTGRLFQSKDVARQHQMCCVCVEQHTIC